MSEHWAQTISVDLSHAVCLAPTQPNQMPPNDNTKPHDCTVVETLGGLLPNCTRGHCSIQELHVNGTTHDFLSYVAFMHPHPLSSDPFLSAPFAILAPARDKRVNVISPVNGKLCLLNRTNACLLILFNADYRHVRV